jgi:hypothetical protein
VWKKNQRQRRANVKLRFLIYAALVATASTSAVSTVGSAAPAASMPVHCGVGRWAVKTLSDSRASEVNFTPKPTTVDALRSLSVSAANSATPRTAPFETRTYRVQAVLVEARRESDHDFHLIIAQPGAPTHTMIVELPDPNCKGAANSLKKTQIAAARSAFISACGTPPSSPASFKHLHGTATITGVGFVDVVHTPAQEGVAPNDVELHPVLRLSSLHC